MIEETVAPVLLFVKGVVIGLAVSVPMGPIGVLCVQRTINRGRFYGMVSGFGAAFADTVFAIIAVFGLTVMKNFMLNYSTELQVFGVAVLLVLGAKIFFTNPVTQIRRRARSSNKGVFGDFLSVFFLTLSNPLTVLFFGATIAALGIHGPDDYFYSQLILVGGISAGATTWWISLTSIVNIFRHKFRLKQLWWINKISGIVILSLSILAGLLLLLRFLGVIAA
ncbi:MAG: LysE family transporter [Salinivirgaceae bacterium]|jgi:threonine/homoserine/homoserine lactone efflux protein|nr:LysE family transporter [Salinivirgaceae bacterium]